MAAVSDKMCILWLKATISPSRCKTAAIIAANMCIFDDFEPESSFLDPKWPPFSANMHAHNKSIHISSKEKSVKPIIYLIHVRHNLPLNQVPMSLEIYGNVHI